MTIRTAALTATLLYVLAPLPSWGGAANDSKHHSYASLFVGRMETPHSQKRFKTVPYLDETEEFQTGTVCYDDVIYTDVLLRYDEYRQHLVVRNPDGNINVVPQADHIQWFDMSGRHFVHDIENPATFSQELYNTEGTRLIRHTAKVVAGSQIVNNIYQDILERREYYTVCFPDGSHYRVKTRNDFVSIFPEHKKDIKAYSRAQRLSFSKERRAADLQQMAQYTCQYANNNIKGTESTAESVQNEELPATNQATTSIHPDSIQTGIPALDNAILVSEARGNEYVASKTYIVPGVRKAWQSLSDDHELDAIVVVAGRQSAVKSATMGSEKFKPQLLKNIPSALGEVDIMKIVLTLPGVKTVGEASNGYNVRGGATDQNLILFNGGTVYNPTHLFGLFTSFNSDMVEDVELFKSSIPAQYGGRISSVLNVTSKEASMKRFGGSASIGLLTSKLNLELPIVKDHLSLLVNARTTYSDWLLKKLPEKSGYKDGKANFYDLGGVLTWKINDLHRLKVYGYFSNDRFSFSTDNKYGYANRNISAEWRSILGEFLTMSLSGGQDHYDYFNDEHMDIPSMGARLSFAIDQTWGKLHFRHRPSEKHTLTYGISAQHYNVKPGTYRPLGEKSKIQYDEMEHDKAMESAIYVDEDWRVTEQLTLQGGIRMTMFNVLGPHSVRVYPENEIPSEANLIETKEMTGITKSYFAPELRFSARYAIRENLSVKAGFNTMTQNIHKVSNTSVMSPTDIWKLSDNNIRPQKGWQVSAGLYGQTENKKYEASIETYYKSMKDYLNYRNGAILLMNHHIETDVISTNGYAAGVELQLKKPTGKLNGWVSYCYSRTFLRQDDKRVAMPVNDGEWFPTEYDRPHELKAVLNYKFTERYSFSGNFDYSTGRPTTVPAGKYYDNATNSFQPYYTKRNGYRLPDYMRCDVAFNIEPTHKITALLHGSFSLGVYNVFARKNAYSIYYVVENGEIKGYKLSVFGSAIPYVAINIRF